MSWWCLCHYAMSLMSFCIIVCHRDPRRRRHKSWKVQKTRSVDWFLSLPARFSVCTTSEYVIKLKSLATIGCCDHGIAAILHAPISSSLLLSTSWLLLHEASKMSLQNKKKYPLFPGLTVTAPQKRRHGRRPAFQEKLFFTNCTWDLPISVYMQLDTSENEPPVQSASKSTRQSYRRQSASEGTRPLLLYRRYRRRIKRISVERPRGLNHGSV